MPKEITMTLFTALPITRTSIAAVLAGGMLASMLAAAPARAASAPPPAATAHIAEDLGLHATELAQGLEFIDRIPESVLLAGDAALRAWLVANHPELLRESRADLVGCAGAIAWLIASTAIPAAKILKIKKLIDGLGGVAKAVKLFWGASFKWEKIQALGGAAAALGAELLGIAAVKQKCFS